MVQFEARVQLPENWHPRATAADARSPNGRSAGFAGATRQSAVGYRRDLTAQTSMARRRNNVRVQSSLSAELAAGVRVTLASRPTRWRPDSALLLFAQSNIACGPPSSRLEGDGEE